MSLLDKAKNMNKFYNYNKPEFKLEDQIEFGIVRDTLVKYGMPTKNFDNNLSVLSINKNHDKDAVDYTAGAYLASSNTVSIPKERDDYIHELFHMASNDSSDKNSLIGCKIRIEDVIFGESLNEGITDYFTSLAVKDYESRHPVEAFFASYIAKIYGMDIFKEHFNGNAVNFYDAFGEDKRSIIEIIGYLDDFHEKVQGFYKHKKSQNSKDSQSTNNLENIKYLVTNANVVSAYFLDFVNEFVEFMQSKNLDAKEFVDSLGKMLDTEGNKFIDIINAFFSFSKYKSKDNIIKKIFVNKDEESFSL